MSELIDLEAAKEFMTETLDKVDKKYLIQLAKDLEVKSGYFKQHLSKDNLPNCSEADLLFVFKLIFPIKRKAKKIIEDTGLEKMKELIHALLHGDQPTQQRFQKFCNAFDFEEKSLSTDLASELLHFTDPNQYWLWSRWMWDSKLKTGSLPLVVTEGFDLNGHNSGTMYMKVGRAVVFVHSMSDVGGYKFIHDSLFGTDVYLSCVYVIYAYTILKMRMTQEFNKVMPGVVEFSRRILGIYRISELTEVVK